MTRSLRAVAALILCAGLSPAADPTVKIDKAAPPADVPEAARKLLGEQSLHFYDAQGKLQADVWFRKEIPVKATEAQLKNGITYQEVPQTTLLGVVKVHEATTDYKKHTVKPGLYTMRLAYQPMDGDHMGTAPSNEFVILVPAAVDKGEETFKPEMLHKLGTRTSGTGHPAVWLLFPVGNKELNKAPAVSKKEGGHWVLTVTQPVDAGGKKGVLGIALTLIGVSPSA